MAVTIKDLFLHFKYYSCCQGDKDTIVLEFSKDGKKGLEDRVPKVINTHTHTFTQAQWTQLSMQSISQGHVL